MTDRQQQVALAAQAFVYGYPLVAGLDEIAGFVGGTTHLGISAPYNTFAHARRLAGPEMDFVTPNNDTCYSIAMCDVRPGPILLRVPDTGGRYYVLQFVDAWTNNFAYVGRRATGTAAGTFLLAPRDYDGPLPEGATVVRAPTGVFAIVGRVQVDGEADLPAVHALQDRLTLEPLGAAEPAGVPAPDPRVTGDLAWWERMRVSLLAFPPPAADGPFLEACAALGLTRAASPFPDMAPEQAAVLVEGAAAGRARIEELMQDVAATPEGWQSAAHVFDYNLDHFEVGTRDEPAWTIADRATAYATRAVAARAGLWGNHGYEADYALIWVDADGEPLRGDRRYELRLEADPPVDAFWSLTMYDTPGFRLVANPIGRYSIGDRTPGIVRDPGGGLTVRMQAGPPGPGLEANWLPAPPGPFRPVLRMYQPRAEVLDGTYVLPAIRRVG